MATKPAPTPYVVPRVRFDAPRITDPEVLRPTRQVIADMKAVINADILVHGNIVCARAGHCALGALLFAIGYTNRELALIPGVPNDWPREVVEKFWTFYRIGAVEATRIFEANDSINHLEVPSGTALVEDMPEITRRLNQIGQTDADTLGCVIDPAVYADDSQGSAWIGLMTANLRVLSVVTEQELEARRAAVLAVIDTFVVEEENTTNLDSYWPQLDPDRTIEDEEAF